MVSKYYIYSAGTAGGFLISLVGNATLQYDNNEGGILSPVITISTLHQPDKLQRKMGGDCFATQG